MDDQTLILLWNSIMNNPTISTPYVDRKPAYQNVPYTSNSLESPFTVYSNNVAGDNGARLASVSISVDAVFQSGFQNNLFIDGVTGVNGKTFLPFDPTVSTFEQVPQGEFMYLKPGASVLIQAYYTGSGSTNGSMSVSVVSDQLSLYQAAIKRAYDKLVAKSGEALGAT